MLKKFFLNYVDALNLFNKRKGKVFAAASSFYVVISLVPLTLLVIRLVGFFMGGLSDTQKKIFLLLSKLFPEMAPEVFLRVKDIIVGPLYAHESFTYINFVILFICSLAFFSSIWNGLYLITKDKAHISFLKHLKGVAIIGLTVVLVTVLLLIPAFYAFIMSILQNNFLVVAIEETFPSFSANITPYFTLVSEEMVEDFLIKSNIFNTMVFLLYFTFLYRWFFSAKISFKEAFVGSLTFVTLIWVGKKIFWIYFTTVRGSLIVNYGDYYTFIVGLIWVFFTMCFFFYSACLCKVIHYSWRDHPDFEEITNSKLHLLGFFRRLVLSIQKIVIRVFNLKN